jgi:HEAT repeat protein
VHYTNTATICYVLETLRASQSWRFDALSALIGAVVALVLAGLAYAFRSGLGRVGRASLRLLAEFLDYMRASTEENYRRLIAATARSLIIPEHAALLEAVFVEPELLVPPSLPQSVSDVEPITELPTQPLGRILEGHPQLVIVGDSGAGRTMALAYLTVVCATTYEKPDRRVKANISDAVRQRLPIYILLPAMNWGSADEEDAGATDDGGLDRLLDGAVSAAGGTSALAKPVRQYVEAGQAIVLADGWDDLLPYQRKRATAWLAGLTRTLPGNVWVVSTGTRGYGMLTEAGFVPLTLAPWDAGQVEAFARKWAGLYTQEGELPQVSMRLVIADLQSALRTGSSPLELALRAFLHFSGHSVPDKRAGLFDAVMDLLLQEQAQEGEPWWLATCRATLGQVALELQQGGRETVSREEIERAIESALPPSEERPAHAARRVFHALTGEHGLLYPVGSDYYAFVHRLWLAYLAARQLVAADPSVLMEHMEDPRWSEVLRFYAELGDMRPLVSEWLRTPDDVFNTRLRTLGAWVSVAPEGATWREGTMAVLAKAFIHPGTIGPAKKVLANALAATGMPGVTYFLKQALQHPEAEVRLAAVTGLARIAKETDLPSLEPLLEDKDAAVREAVVHALAYAGFETSWRWLELILLEGNDDLRPVAAAALADCGEAGVGLLRKLVESEDVMTRRAAIYGLAQVGAKDLLTHAAREDEQWIVRSAASAALDEIEKRETSLGVESVPELERLPWLISWAADRGEGVGLGEAARGRLRQALVEGNPKVRLAAAQILRQIGRPDDIQSLRAAIADTDSAVVNAVVEAVGEIGRRYDLHIRARTPVA